MKYDTDKMEIVMEKLAAKNLARIKSNKTTSDGQRSRGQGWQPYVVAVGEFRLALKQSGIAYPEDAVAFAALMKPIADKILPKYRRQLAKTP